MRLGRDGLCVSHVVILTVGHAGNLLDQVLAGRIVPAVNRMGVVKTHGAARSATLTRSTTLRSHDSGQSLLLLSTGRQKTQG